MAWWSHCSPAGGARHGAAPSSLLTSLLKLATSCKLRFWLRCELASISLLASSSSSLTVVFVLGCELATSWLLSFSFVSMWTCSIAATR